MNTIARGMMTALTGGLLVLMCGCAGVDVNPKAATADRGYVDLFTQPKADVWWDIEVYDAKNSSYKEFAASYKAPPAGIFRVEAKPGKHRARITVLNRAVEAPVEVEVEVKAGMITPIRMTAAVAGESFIRVRDDRLIWERMRMNQYEQSVLKLFANVEPPIPYTPKEQTAYWK